MTDQPASELPPPLLGCLYCHAEGTIIQTEGRKFFGLGGTLPLLNCTQCGAIAVLERNADLGTWRIRYRKFSRDKLYHFAAQRLGKAGWLADHDALKISRLVYIQRHRLQQTQRGDLSWLKPISLSPPPPAIGKNETIYLSFHYVTYRQLRSTYRFAHNEGDTILDSGAFYVTNSHVHLIGKRDRSYPLTEIHAFNYNHKSWFLYFQKFQKKDPQRPQEEVFEYFRGDNHPEELDAQLVITIIETLKAKLGDS